MLLLSGSEQVFLTPRGEFLGLLYSAVVIME